MQEFKSDQQGEWDPNYEIKVQHDQELELGGGAADEEPMTLRIEAALRLRKRLKGGDEPCDGEQAWDDQPEDGRMEEPALDEQA